MNAMKTLKTYLFSITSIVVLLVTSCNDFLDREPLSDISPDQYLWEEEQLGAYAINQYDAILPTHTGRTFGTFGIDAVSDNMTGMSFDAKYVPGEWRVPASGGEWNFDNIRKINYFLHTVVPRWKEGLISGNANYIEHYIGEMYFLRAYEYFYRLHTFGDFPIIREPLPDIMETLVESSKRDPHTEVARFIISDLDSAIMLLRNSGPNENKTRISQNSAYLLKSRVALYEGTWLKYFKGTALVPNGPGWPGADKDYNANYQFPSGSIDGEIEYFLNQAIDASKIVAEAVALVENNGIIEALDNTNPYFNMFSNEDMNIYSEVLLWRQYSKSQGVTHNVPVYAGGNNDGVGLTRSLVESFLMASGLPIYADGNYRGDNSISDVKEGRDGRLVLFLKEPGQKNILREHSDGTHAIPVEPVPAIDRSVHSEKYTSGYTIRKGLNYDAKHFGNGLGYTGCLIFRATEAYLNYIEAYYEKNGVLDETAERYWRAIRNRAKVDNNFGATIAATDMSKETKDWGAYSAGQLIDPTLYNIRRERRCELMAEGFRHMDLKRWRALDQMITTPYHIEGFKLWNSDMTSWYTSEQLQYGDATPIVSNPVLGDYLRPYALSSTTHSYQGCRWTLAHYLTPIAMEHFVITSSGGDYANSPIYQNPGWPIQSGLGATDL